MAEPVVVVGAGCAGLVASLAAAGGGATVELFDVVNPLSATFEDESSTARSTGLIPAAGTSLQRAVGIQDDSPELQAKDIIEANKGQCDVELVRQVCQAAGVAVEWLVSTCGIELVCSTDFLYHGHSKHRMHGPRAGYGRCLVQMLARKVQEHPKIHCHYGVEVQGLIVQDGCVCGIRTKASPGQLLGCAVILATCGFGANRDMISKYIDAAGLSSVSAACYQGSPHDNGAGMLWGAAAGGELVHMGAYQGHATVSDSEKPMLITYGIIVNGGILVNSSGARFGNENVGYSEFSTSVLAQGAGVVELFGQSTYEACKDTRLQEVEQKGLIMQHESLEAVAETYGLPIATLLQTVDAVNAAAVAGQVDSHGRLWDEMRHPGPLSPPFRSILVRGALFHTQGGLRVDIHGRVQKSGGEVLPGLLAAGGAAAGVSGEGVEGYLSGNGLLTAVVYGKAAGDTSSAMFRAQQTAPKL